MDGISIAAVVIAFGTVVLRVVHICGDYKQLIVTEELIYLLSNVDNLRATATCHTTTVGDTLRYVSPSSEADFEYKALCEDLQMMLVNFMRTAKTMILKICGETGSKLSTNYQSMVKLERMQSRKALFQDLHDRLSSQQSSIKPLVDMYSQKAPVQSMDTPISTKRSKVFTPQLVNAFHQGKNDYLDDLLQMLQPLAVKDSAQNRQMICIYGKERTGKTHLCSKFADEHKTSYSCVFWLDAENGCFESLYPTLSTIAAVGELSGVEESWLLVIDNVGDLTDAEKHFPSGDKVHILVTTRSSPPGSVDSVHVSEMDEKEKMRYLLWSAGLAMPWLDSERAWAEEVIAQFGPRSNLLPLTHVGVVIRNRFCPREEYLALFKKQRTKESKANILQGSQDLPLKVALTQIRKQKTWCSKDALILLHYSAIATSRYITLDALANSILAFKTATKQQKLIHRTCFDQSRKGARSWRKSKVFTSEFFGSNADIRSMPQSSSNPAAPGGLDRSRAKLATRELVDMPLFLYHPSNDRYSIQPAAKQWVADRLNSLRGTLA
ncbi:hypothetical protein VN97_g2990 [Penicillium thymicola]|uniref:NB-ARC domain-containing protein n=1 Tax=Penicillium thymicola TaxID=293382 RepID=A0AAI9TP75_PENTH|nr:hypothetical protein VN97_g2990 [Penicillium thymicola]